MPDDPQDPPADPQDPPSDPPADPPADPPGDDATDGDADKWKAMARKHERAAKNAQAELDKIRKANQSAEEKAIDEAKAAGRAEATTEFASLLAAARLEAAGLPAEIVEDLDLSKFVNEDGTVDTDKVAATANKHKAQAPNTGGGADGGPQGGDTSKPPQLSEADLVGMSAEQIVEAKAKGQLDVALGIKTG